MNCRDHGLDAATSIEVAYNAHPFGLRARYQIVQYPVHRALVEDPIVPVAPEIELEALQLDALLPRYIGNANRAEIGSAALQEREFLGVALDPSDGA